MTIQCNVCIVGAGATGLIAAYVLRQHGHAVTIFEQNAYIGGQWRYSDSISAQSTSAVYHDLVTNLTHDVMQLSQIPFPPATPRYPRHEHVLQYLEDFAASERLHDCIRFQHTVTLIEPTTGADSDSGSGGRFTVSVGDVRYRYDAVVVCSGHFVVPAYPSVAGLAKPTPADVDHYAHCVEQYSHALPPSLSLSQQRPPLVLHSFHYRRAEHFAGLRVLVVGASHSGTDIASELCTRAQHVYLACKAATKQQELYQAVISRLKAAGKPTADTFDNFTMVSGVTSIDGSGVVYCEKDERITVDVIVVATGYDYCFPFISNSFGLKFGDHVDGLWQHLFAPSSCGFLSFPALQFATVPFPMTEIQLDYQARILSGELPFPSQQRCHSEMATERRDRMARGLHGRWLEWCQSMPVYVRKLIDEMERSSTSGWRESWRWTIDDDRRLRKVALQ